MRKQDTYKAAGIVLLVLLLLSFWAKEYYKLDHNYLTLVVLAFAVVLYTFEGAAILFVKYWMKFGKLLGDINAKIILSLLFVLILVPVALLKKITAVKTEETLSNWKSISNEAVDFTKPW